MEFEKCVLCGVDLEYLENGRAMWDTGKAPFEFKMCYDCIKELKELEVIDMEYNKKEKNGSWS